MERRPNRLAREKSPYLLQHAFNPVDWYPWGSEAIQKAEREGKPILLSIGYSTCHWCHVMERESFEDEETARLINENFVPVKVDREERPDIDQIYMTAVQAMTGQGGWPLTVFLTPELKPFYGGTYFPPEPRYGMPSFKQVLGLVSRLWRDRRGEVLQSASQVMEALQRESAQGGPGRIEKRHMEECFASIAASFDEEYGGFGTAPKFPLPTYIIFLLRYNYRSGKELARSVAVKTLEGMLRGGIRDHLGGGFHRYSTDRGWLVPHFEKMLYDNALLARVYMEAFQATGEASFLSVAEETLDWLSREMVGEGGAFCSAQDADTVEGEGKYYTWTVGEVMEVLGREEGDAFCYMYGVSEAGNHEGRSVLHLAHTPGETASRFGMQRDRLESMVRRWKGELYRRRLERPRPQRDDKIIASWNGLAISAFAFASAVLHEEQLARKAEKAAQFVTEKMVRDGRLFRRYRDGEVAVEGTLEDYAFLSQGLLDLFEATSEPEWLRRALEMTEEALKVFGDGTEGILFSSAPGGAPVRLKETYDGPVPSGNSVMAMNLVRISGITGDVSYAKRAEGILEGMAQSVEVEPASHTYALCAADMLLNGMREVVVTSRERAKAKELLRAIWSRYLPDKAVVVATSENSASLKQITSLLEGREPGENPTAYVCMNFACKYPVNTVEQLEKQLLEKH
jgi:uncharacterized protein YyaL (SSP411 family)